MEIGIDFVDYLKTDLTSSILTFLNDPVDLVRVSCVSRPWRHFVIAHGICKKLWLKKVPQIANLSYVDEESNRAIMLSDIFSGNPADWQTLEVEHKIYTSLLQTLAQQPVICPEDDVVCPEDDVVSALVHTISCMGSELLKLTSEIEAHEEENSQMLAKLAKLEADRDAEKNLRVLIQLNAEKNIERQDNVIARQQQSITTLETHTSTLLEELCYLHTHWEPRKSARPDMMAISDKYVTWEATPASTSAAAAAQPIQVSVDSDPEEEEEDAE